MTSEGSTPAPRKRARLVRWLVRGVATVVLTVVALAVGGAVNAVVNLPDLGPWHRLSSALEPRAAEMGPSFTLDDYLAREEAVFREARERVDAVVSQAADPAVANRYVVGSRSYPGRLPGAPNRTTVLEHPDPRGGAVLVHGLTDSPYAMRSLAMHLHAMGYYTLSLRMQGHGTVPGGLLRPAWEDWRATVGMGARHVRARIGPDRPLVLVGYSNGGALVTKYALDALGDQALPQPAAIVLLSPMVGVTRAAGLAGAISLLGPVIPKAHWTSVVPEYNPVKYNSFTANAATQTARLTRALDQQVDALAKAGRLDRLPPVLAFQSAVDSTVSTAAVFGLFSRLPAGRHEIVLFDLNRQADVDAFTIPGTIAMRPPGDATLPYAFTLVTNLSPSTGAVVARTVASGSRAIDEEQLGLSWPDGMYSLSHIALPFAPDDPVFGGDSTGREAGSLSLGRLTVRGEKGTLIVPAEVLMRVSWNPFFPYLTRRVEGWVTTHAR